MEQYFVVVAARGLQTQLLRAFVCTETPNMLYLRGGEIIKGTLNKKTSKMWTWLEKTFCRKPTFLHHKHFWQAEQTRIKEAARDQVLQNLKTCLSQKRALDTQDHLYSSENESPQRVHGVRHASFLSRGLQSLQQLWCPSDTSLKGLDLRNIGQNLLVLRNTYFACFLVLIIKVVCPF